ncbi:MAG: alpha/beta hydrolase-fold protein [Bacteroidota bacterium]
MKFRTIEISDPRFETLGLRHVTVKSLALNQRADITLYVPRVSFENEAIPIVILLHGVYGSHWAWAWKGGAHLTADRLIVENKIRPMILAMPSDGLWGDGSGYLKHEAKDFESWIVEEVPEIVRQVSSIHADSPVFIGGLSMGGYGALRLGAKYPGQFRGMSGLSSIVDFTDWQPFMEEEISMLPVPEKERNVLYYFLKNRNNLPPFRFDCGTADELIGSNRKLHKALVFENIPHEYKEFPGGHEWPYWEMGLGRSLLFFENILCSHPEVSELRKST